MFLKWRFISQNIARFKNFSELLGQMLRSDLWAILGDAF